MTEKNKKKTKKTDVGNPFSYKYLDRNTGFLFFQLATLWKHQQDMLLRNLFSISQLQYAILASLYWRFLHNEEVSQTAMLKHTKISKMNLSNNIKVLESRGYIVIKINDRDARKSNLALTTQGEELITKAIQLIEPYDMQFFSGIGKDIEKFDKMLGTLVEYNEHKNYLYFLPSGSY
jgi:DNA-binding MarR family transcriptional regulator